MKKISVLLITILLMVSFVSCGSNKNADEPTSDTVILTEPTFESQLTDTAKDEMEYTGARVKMSTYNKDNVAQYYYITLPTDVGREILYGRGSAALDGTWVLCGGSFINKTIECDSIENIYDDYADRWEESIEDMHHDGAYSDFKFIAEKREMTEINGFSMCRYEGTHTYNHTDFTTGAVTPYSCYFVAYGTQLSEGGYVYWIVFDNSADQSLRDIVNKNAENMAKSLEETTLF